MTGGYRPVKLERRKRHENTDDTSITPDSVRRTNTWPTKTIAGCLVVCRAASPSESDVTGNTSPGYRVRTEPRQSVFIHRGRVSVSLQSSSGREIRDFEKCALISSRGGGTRTIIIIIIIALRTGTRPGRYRVYYSTPSSPPCTYTHTYMIHVCTSTERRSPRSAFFSREFLGSANFYRSQTIATRSYCRGIPPLVRWIVDGFDDSYGSVAFKIAWRFVASDVPTGKIARSARSVWRTQMHALERETCFNTTSIC